MWIELNRELNAKRYQRSKINDQFAAFQFMNTAIPIPDYKFSRLVFFTNGLVPLLLLVWDGINHRLGANPLGFVTTATGTLTLVFLSLSLAVTPLRKITGWNWLIKHRRLLGLYAFFYATLHMLCYIVFDRALNLRSTFADVINRPFIAVGMLSFLLLIPLALTSTNNMIKRLGGKRWARLHKLTYVVAIGGCLHYYMLVKLDTTKPLIFAAIFAILLGYRYIEHQNNQTPMTIK
ncbi:MAG: sulfoxide reductase heme-binding subunit YedZ [Pyrinomonadaceae bacterium]